MSDSGPIRVMVVDDHDMVRRGLATFLKVKADLQLVGEARDGEEALRLCGEVRPDVVLMDVLMPRMGGAEATIASAPLLFVSLPPRLTGPASCDRIPSASGTASSIGAPASRRWFAENGRQSSVLSVPGQRTKRAG